MHAISHATACIHTTRTCIHIDIHTYIHTWGHMNMHVKLVVCSGECSQQTIKLCIHTTLTCLHTYIHTYIHKWAHPMIVDTQTNYQSIYMYTHIHSWNIITRPCYLKRSISGGIVHSLTQSYTLSKNTHLYHFAGVIVHFPPRSWHTCRHKMRHHQQGL